MELNFLIELESSLQWRKCGMETSGGHLCHFFMPIEVQQNNSSDFPGDNS